MGRLTPPGPGSASGMCQGPRRPTMPEQSNPRKVQKVGNSQGITLPPDLLESAGLSIGDRVVVTEEDGELTVKKVTWSTQ